ncbi:hypothetical protein J3Q64DRAFT_1749930 [Phycomyces blakesleeanus]|uniref:Uncharacterized protein n=1 Tax=Phycomyces blakesleeanus TaxID=4837 RepID=A0ABR3AVL7_PHYBL
MGIGYLVTWLLGYLPGSSVGCLVTCLVFCLECVGDFSTRIKHVPHTLILVSNYLGPLVILLQFYHYYYYCEYIYIYIYIYLVLNAFLIIKEVQYTVF